jgi:hypothetical protein
LKILKYSTDNLLYALSNEYTIPENVKKKKHFKYLKSYLSPNGINAKTILIEESYNSVDYLLDFQDYYLRCFKKYPKFCKRVHFFSNEFDKEYFDKILLETKKSQNFWNNYLGFIVVRPIPITVLGYTILKTYPEKCENEIRSFWGTRPYKVHIFGIEHRLNTLVFQEQDQVLSACATTAIWITLSGVGLSSDLKIKSPGRITLDAGNISHDGSRIFPNHGLSIRQICLALNVSGLVTELINPDITITKNKVIESGISHSYLRKIINAYSPIKIPIILAVYVPGAYGYGPHAITVSGFSQKEIVPQKPKKEISFSCDRITKLYIHDDQYGPFVRLDFSDKTDYGYITPWSDNHLKKLETFIKVIVVPLFPKIRIGYKEIEDVVYSLDTALSFFLKETEIETDILWDIKVHYSSDFKEKIKNYSIRQIDESIKLHTLKKHYPKYIWIASCTVNGYEIFDFIFDATDIAHGMVAFDVISYFSDLPQLLFQSIKDFEPQYLTAFKKLPSGVQYFQFFKKKLKKISERLNRS